MKKIILAIFLIVFTAPVFADEINLTPKNSFSGFNNNGIRAKYPQLKNSVSATDVIEERDESSIMAPKSVKQMRNTTTPSSSDRSTPMTYSQFPQNYDSSNSMMLMQGGVQSMQNMFMGL